jgi:alpha-1,2-mannosyltransferase
MEGYSVAEPRVAEDDRPGGLVARVRGVWLRGQMVWQIITVIALAVGVTVFLLQLAARHGFFDLRVYYGALNYWAHGGGELYDYYLPKSTYGFTYPPFAAIVMLPMAVTAWPVTILISLVLSVGGTLVLLFWLVDPISRRQGWTRWFALAIAACLAAAFEPLRETVNFGQVNMVLVFLVAVDLLLLVGRGHRFGGVLIGLATAIKLTPGIFIVYLLVTRRFRAALIASGTAAVATVAAAAIAPDASRIFWTDALWNTDRVGAVAFISNQSINGAVARLHPSDPSTLLWVLGVLAVATIWFFRVRRAVASGDEMTGLALTGVLGCLMSPITWVHHLVWVGPAIVLLLDNALTAQSRRRRWALFGFFVGAYVLLCSRLVWEFNLEWDNPVGWFLASAYVWISIALLVALPIRDRRTLPDERVPQLGELDRDLAGLLDRDRGDLPVGSEAAPLVERPRPGVSLQHP